MASAQKIAQIAVNRVWRRHDAREPQSQLLALLPKRAEDDFRLTVVLVNGCG
jgi:hypothetical protein